MHPESAVSDYVAYLRNQEYKPGLITGGRTGSTRFARFLVGRPIAKGEQVRGDWQPDDQIPAHGRASNLEDRHRIEVALKAEIRNYVCYLKQRYSPETAAEYRDWAIWFALFLVGRRLLKGERRPDGWWPAGA